MCHGKHFFLVLTLKITFINASNSPVRETVSIGPSVHTGSTKVAIMYLPSFVLRGQSRQIYLYLFEHYEKLNEIPKAPHHEA